MNFLSLRELYAMDKVAKGKPLGEHLKDFHRAESKLRFATRTNRAESLPELKLDCDYSLKWFKANRGEVSGIVERYQTAVHAAGEIFWSIRSAR